MPLHDSDAPEPAPADLRLTRRAFARLAGSAAALAVLGCAGCGDAGTAEEDRRSNRARLATEPFLVGPPGRYAAEGVYAEYAPSKGVFLYSNGAYLVALSATCTHNACATVYDRVGGQYRCPCHSSLFTLDGLNKDGSKATRPLERCALRLRGTADGPQLEVDPTTRFRQERNHEWMSPRSMHRLDGPA